MALNPDQYQAIMSQYEKLQAKNRHLLDQRIEEIYQKIPEYEKLEQLKVSTSISASTNIINGSSSSIHDLHIALKEIRIQKENCLLAHGYPANYLQPIYQCIACQDTGYANNQKCTCFKQKEIILLYEQASILSLSEINNFNTIDESYYKDHDLDNFRHAVTTSELFVKNFLKDYQNILFYGTVGTGKTFLSSCIAKELWDQNYTILYFGSISFFNLLGNYIFSYENKKSNQKTYDDIYNCDLLILDDLGTELTNHFVVSQLFECINMRNIKKRATIISTNLSLAEIQATYTERIFSRIISSYELCKLTGSDIRLLKKTLNK